MFPDIKDVEFGDNSQCKAWIEEAHSKELADFFEKEHEGSYKSDLCRLAQLYLRGGYYFDNDLEPVMDFRSHLPPCASIASVLSSEGGIFQAFLATPARHPAVERALRMTHLYYLHKLNGLPKKVPVGTGIMQLALAEFQDVVLAEGEVENGVFLLKERAPEDAKYVQEMSPYDVCNHGVWSGNEQWFFSRVIGRISGEPCKHRKSWLYHMPNFVKNFVRATDKLRLPRFMQTDTEAPNVIDYGPLPKTYAVALF